MATKSNTVPAPEQRPVRALMHFDVLPPKHQTFMVANDSCGVHLQIGEFAVVDLSDREPQHGELYVIQYDSGRRPRRVIQARSTMEKITPKPPKQQVWWVGDLAGYRQVGSASDPKGRGQVPMFTGLSDGPYKAEHLRSKLLGRIVGYSDHSLGAVMAPEAGWEDEDQHNAAFDAGEYLDVLRQTGHDACVMISKGEPSHYYEALPRRALSEEEWSEVNRVRTKYCAASTAHERVVLECVRRGLVEIRN